jgi:hypothetical protein
MSLRLASLVAFLLLSPAAAYAAEGVCLHAPFGINYEKGRGYSIPVGYHCFDTTASEAFSEDPDQIVMVLAGKGRKIFVGVRVKGTGKPESVARKELLHFYRVTELRATVERIYYGEYDGFVLITPTADAAMVEDIMSGFIISGGAKLTWHPSII